LGLLLTGAGDLRPFYPLAGPRLRVPKAKHRSSPASVCCRLGSHASAGAAAAAVAPGLLAKVDVMIWGTFDVLRLARNRVDN